MSTSESQNDAASIKNPVDHHHTTTSSLAAVEGGGREISAQIRVLSPTGALSELMADDDFDVLAMYIGDDQDDSAAVAKAEAKEKRRQNFQIRKPPSPPLSPEEMERDQINLDMLDKLFEYDPKTGSSFYTRLWFLDFTKFDIDEETRYGPMRFTDSLIKESHKLRESLNVLCVKIKSSDVGFPINVYGTVIIRDGLDFRCNYIFRRDRNNCQPVKSQGDSLILIGPSRGVVFICSAYFEIDLKIREEGEERDDRKFNKAFVHVDGQKINNLVQRKTVGSWLSEVELVFIRVKEALEGTIEIKILSGPESFIGKITASTTDLPYDNEMLLYDSSVGGAVTTSAGTGRVIQLFRRVVAVSADQMLVFRIWDGSACIYPHTASFTPLINGAGRDVVPCGLYKMQVQIVWSTLMD